MIKFRTAVLVLVLHFVLDNQVYSQTLFHTSSLSNGTGGALLSNPNGVFVSGNYAYVSSNGSNALEIIDISNPAAPVHKGSLSNGSGGALLSTPQSVYVSGNYAYLGSSGNNALEIVDISNPAAPVHKGSLTNGTGGALLSGVRGVFVSGNYAYLASNGNDALEIVDVTNPASPVHKSSLTNGTGGALLSGPRSVFVSGNYAYVVSQSASTFEIVNISNPAAPVHSGSLTNGTGGAILSGAYGVYVSGNYAYITSSTGNALEIVDVTNPVAPVHKGSLTNGTGGALLGGPQSVYISGNYAFVSSSTSNAIEVVDISNPALPVHKSSLPDGADGALLANCNSVFPSGNYVYVTSWNYSALEVAYFGAFPPTSFVTTWTTFDGTITIPTTGAGYNYSITWTNLTNPGVNEGATFGQTGNYTISGLQNGSTYRVIITGAFPRIYFNGSGEGQKIKTIEQWGNISWTSMQNAFNGCTNLTYNAVDAPNLTNATSLNQMFLGATSFNGDLSSWNTSTITDMAGTFYAASAFNGNISTWNTANVTAMNSMFDYATSFNGDISGWNTSSVTSMGYMFEGATSFNRNLSAWNTSNVSYWLAMFSGATAFNQNLGSWNISSAGPGAMSNMLDNCGLSTDNYDATLAGWAAQTLQTSGSLGAAGLTYCNAVARNTLTSALNNWTINDAGTSAACPVITNVTSSTANGIYSVGAVIPVAVTFNKVVNVVGVPTITLATGTLSRVVNYTSGNGTATLTFNYTVQSGDASADLDYIAWTLTAGTSIKDASSNNANLTLPTPGASGSLSFNKDIIISASTPTLSGFPALNKTLYDASFVLTDPTSNSAGTFTYASSDPTVAAISGNTVTIVAVGTATLTATQAPSGAYGTGTATATLTVTSVETVTQYGEKTLFKQNYLNKNGGLSGQKGVNRTGKEITTKN